MSEGISLQEDVDARAAAALEAFIAPLETTIGGFTLRPISLTSLMQLKQTKNEFFDPRGPDGTIENEMLAAMSFGYIHSAPEAEVRRAVFAPTYFLERVQAWGENLTAAHLPLLIAEIIKRTKAVRTLQFSVQEKKKDTEAKQRAESEENEAPPPN